jgi:hypothetical protein
MTRTDIHRPSALIPEDYSFRYCFAYPGMDGAPPVNMDLIQRDRQAGIIEQHFSKGGCHVCGASYRYGAAFTHLPTGKVILVGWICAEQIEHHSWEGDRKHVLSEVKRLAARAQRRLMLRSFVEHASPELLQALRLDHGITQDIRRWLIRNGNISEAQEQLLLKLVVQARQQAEREAEEQDEVHVPVPVDGERITLEGTVVGLRWVDNDFGGAFKITLKIEAETGVWLCWGTCPQGLLDQSVDKPSNGQSGNLRGSRVRFVAKVTPGNREPHFGFFSRPTKPALLEVFTGAWA